MVWLSASFDPSGDFLFEQTCKVLLELASHEQGSLRIDSHNLFPDWNRPYAEQREHQEQCQFLLWQFATNPNPKREIGRYHIHFRMTGMKTFMLQVGVHAPYKPAQHLLFSQSIIDRGCVDKAQNPPVALLVLNAMEEGSWPLTTGKLAYFLEQFAAIGRIRPMPQELRRDLEARAGKPLQKDELGEWPYLTQEQIGRLLPPRKDSLYGRFLNTTYKDGSLELTPRDADFSDQTEAQG